MELYYRSLEILPHRTLLDLCQDFEFPVLLVLLYVCVASLFYIERVGPDQF
jgi:hypothetical protein